MRIPGAVACYIVCLAVAWSVAPGEVPLHWSGVSEPDRFGSRTEFALSGVVLGLVLVVVLIGSTWLIRRGSVEFFNVPHADYWRAPKRESRLRKMAEDDLVTVMAPVFVFMGGLSVVIAWRARQGEFSLPLWWLLCGVGAYFVLLGWSLWRMRAKYQPPGSGDA